MVLFKFLWQMVIYILYMVAQKIGTIFCTPQLYQILTICKILSLSESVLQKHHDAAFFLQGQDLLF